MKLYNRLIFNIFFVVFFVQLSATSTFSVPLAPAASYGFSAEETRIFRGYFPGKRYEVFIYFTQEGKDVSCAIKYGEDFQTTNLEGTINEEGEFELFEMEKGEKTGVSLVGYIQQNRMVATFTTNEEEINFQFRERQQRKTGKQTPLSEIERHFTPLPLPLVLKYKANAKPMSTNARRFFLDKPIGKIASYQPEFKLAQRTTIMQKIMYGGKINLNHGLTALVVHAAFGSRYDGNLYNSYVFVFDHKDAFIQAFVVYESTRPNDTQPLIYTTLSESEKFAVKNLTLPTSEQRQVFKFNKTGELEFSGR